jgi:hypothetical protein
VTGATQTHTGLYVLTLASSGELCAFVASSELGSTFVSVIRLSTTSVRLEVRSDAGTATNADTNLVGVC